MLPGSLCASFAAPGLAAAEGATWPKVVEVPFCRNHCTGESQLDQHADPAHGGIFVEAAGGQQRREGGGRGGKLGDMSCI